MAMLHIIRSSGFSSNALTQCLSMTLPQDSILLIDDGCYNLNHPLLLNSMKNNHELTVYFIELHAEARAQHSSNNAPFIAMALKGALDLIFKHDNSITWS